MEPKRREALIKGFHEGSSQILITTDVLARGLNNRGSLLSSPPVINYDLPAHKENYIHRLDRGSHGGSVIAINFVTTDDVRTLRDIERGSSSRQSLLIDPELIYLYLQSSITLKSTRCHLMSRELRSQLNRMSFLT